MTAHMFDAPNELGTMIAIVIAAASFTVSIIVLAFVVRGDKRKAGVDIRCNFSVSRSIYSREPWVRSITLQNEKDRSVAIYKIYLEFRHGFYVELDDFTANPVVIGPYGVWHQQFDTVEFYAANMHRLANIFDEQRHRMRIMVATSDGRHYPKPPKRAFDPITYGLSKNFSTTTIQPVRLQLDGVHYSFAAKYLCTLTDPNGQEHRYPIFSDINIAQTVHGVRLTAESMQSSDSVRQFMLLQIQDEKINAIGVEVLDLEPFREDLAKEYGTTLPYESLGWFEYNVVARWLTLLENIKERRRCRRKPTRGSE